MSLCNQMLLMDGNVHRAESAIQPPPPHSPLPVRSNRFSDRAGELVPVAY